MMQQTGSFQHAIERAFTGDVNSFLSKNCNDFSRRGVLETVGGTYLNDLLSLRISECTGIPFSTAFTPISWVDSPASVGAWMDTQSITERSDTGTLFDALVNRLTQGNPSLFED